MRQMRTSTGNKRRAECECLRDISKRSREWGHREIRGQTRVSLRGLSLEPLSGELLNQICQFVGLDRFGQVRGESKRQSSLDVARLAETGQCDGGHRGQLLRLADPLDELEAIL